MITKEIPRGEWVSFFDEFSRKHQGWIVIVEEVDSDLGDQEEINRLPLVGISADLNAGEKRITITAGGRPNSDVNHIINAPKQVWFRHDAIENYDAIDIESETGTKVVMQFLTVPVDEVEHQLTRET